MAEQQLPARWATGQYDDSPRYWGKTYFSGGAMRMDVYEAPPDEFGTAPPIFAANVYPQPDPTFRGVMVAGWWYAVRRPGKEGPPEYADRNITTWSVLGEGAFYGVPIWDPAGSLTLILDGGPIGSSGGPWVPAGGLQYGERVGAAWNPPVDSSRSLTLFLRQCPEGF